MGGYNVLLIDADITLMTDFYAVVKSEPFRMLNHICGIEYRHFACNGGTNYVQNADPDGPLAWMLMDYVDRVSGLGWCLMVLSSRFFSAAPRSHQMASQPQDANNCPSSAVLAGIEVERP